MDGWIGAEADAQVGARLIYIYIFIHSLAVIRITPSLGILNCPKSIFLACFGLPSTTVLPLHYYRICI